MDAKETILMNERKNEKGVTAVEYAIMLFLVAIAVVAVGQGLGGAVDGILTQIETALAP